MCRDRERGRRGAAATLVLLAAGCGLLPPDASQHGSRSGGGTTRPTQALPPPGYVEVWHDEFDGAGLSQGSWTARSERRRDALSTPDAVAVADGLLTLTTYTGPDGVHRTGFVSTQGKFSALYGYFEARIRFQDAPGSWCAFWLNSPTNGVPLGDPGKAGVEIDVVEHRVTDQGGWDALRDMVAINLNWDGYGADQKNLDHVTALPGDAKVQGEWHTYGVLWTESGYTFYVDGAPLWSPNVAVSHVNEDVYLTCEVLDASWAGNVPPAGYGSKTASTTRMDVDWVRAWQRSP
jgi:beta-glucanase (GH16 family)